MLEQRKRILSLIMTLVFVIGILLGNIGPAFAQETTVQTVQFDSDWYSLGQATIRVTDSTVSGSGSVTVTVTSSSDPTGIEVELAEDEGYLGSFTGSLTLTDQDSVPAENMLKVRHDDIITVTYNDSVTDTATIDTIPPQVSSCTPPDGMKGISTDIAQVSVEFSEPINIGGSSGGISITDSSGNPTNIKYTSVVNGNTLVLDLYSGSLRYQETYTVTLPAGSVVDLAGNGCSEVSWSFSTIDMDLDRQVYKPNDTVTVTLYDSAKGSGSVDVEVKSDNYQSDPIYVTLSGSGGVLTGTFRLSGPGGSSDDNNDVLGVTAFYDGITVSYDFNDDGTYDVFAYANVDNEAPVVSTTFPQDGDTNVAIDQPVIITFSEDIKEGSQFNSIDIGYNNGSGWQSAGSIERIIDGKTLTINHADLEYSTTYDVVVYYDSVQDLVGNSYEPSPTTGQTVFRFTTQARPVQTIHVAITGNDSTGNGTESSPYRSISRALEAAYDGDTIIIHDGTYNESVVVTKDVTITSVNGPEKTIIQPAAGDAFSIQPASGSYGTRRIAGFTISGADHGISVSGMAGGEVFLENNVISGCNDGIYVNNHTNGTVYVRKNVISQNTGAGIRLGTNADGDWVEIKWNNIVNNSSGIVHNGSNQLDAKLNFWGNPHGPSHDGINYGDSIEGNINFQPWLVSEFAGEEITTELDISSPTLGEGYVGLEYFAELPVQSYVGNVEWSLYSGSLPGGVDIISGKALYGQPALAGSYSFALMADNGTQAVYRNFVLNVAANYTGTGPMPIIRTPAPYETGVAVNEPVRIVFDKPVVLSGDYDGYINIRNLDSYMDEVIDSEIIETTFQTNDTLVIQHENLRPGTNYRVSIGRSEETYYWDPNNVVYTYYVTDTDGNGFTTSWCFTTSSQVPDLNITTEALDSGTVNQVYNFQLQCVGGSGSYTWSIASGILPTGLQLDSSTGIISGTPTQGGTFNFAVQVTDEMDSTVVKDFSIEIEEVDMTPPELVSTSPGHNETAVPQNITISVEFDEPIQQGSSFDDISIGQNISCTKAIEGNVLKIYPLTNLDANTWYTVEIPAGAVKDMAGNETTSIISFSFQTAETQDTQAPQVSIQSPSGDGGIFSNRLTVTGSVDEESLKLVEVTLFSVEQSKYWNSSTGSWVQDEIWDSANFSGFAPDYDFQYVTPILPDGEYQLSVRALDYADNISEVETVNFKIDSTRPAIVGTVPADQDSDMAVDQPITVTFSEDVVPGDLTKITFKNANTGEGIAFFQVLLDEQTDTLIITHSDLEYGTAYEVFIDEGIVKDLAGNDNVEKFVTFTTTEGDNEVPAPQLRVTFEDDDIDGIYYYRPNGESDTLRFSLSGLQPGLNLTARFGALNENNEFTVTGAVHDSWVTGEESETDPGVYVFSVDIDTPDNNNYRPLAVELSGLPIEIPPFLLVDSVTNPDEPRVAFVNIYAPQPPEESGLELVIEPSLDTVDNLREIPGVTFSMQYNDGTKIGAITIGSESNPLDFLAVDENGVPQLVNLQQAMSIHADPENKEFSAELNTDVLTFLADRNATITFYNVASTLGLQLSEDNFRDMLQIKVFDNSNQEIADIEGYVDLGAMTYSATPGQGYEDCLVIPVSHFTKYTIGRVEAQPLEITTTSLPDGTEGVDYSANLEATGGVGNYTWSIADGSLADGLSLNADGTISGTPTAAGTYEFTVQVTDEASSIAEQELSISIATSGGTENEPSTSHGGTTLWLPSQEETLDKNVDNLMDTVGNPNSSEGDVTYAINRASDSLNSTIEQVETAEDAEKVADTAGKITGAIAQAADKVLSEDAAAKVIDSATKVIEALAKATPKTSSDEARQKLAESVISSLEALEKAAEKISSAEKATEVAKAQITALKNIKPVLETVDNTEASAGLVEKAAALLDSSCDMIDKVANAEKASSVTKEIIESVAALTKTATAEETADARVQQAVWKAQEKVVQVVERTIEKAGTEQLAADQIAVEGSRIKANVDAERLADKAKNVVEKAQELATKLVENEIEVSKELEKKVSVEIPAVQGTDEVEAKVPGSVYDTVFASGIDKLEIKSEVADFGITANTFGEAAKRNDVTLAAKKLAKEQLPETAQSVVPDNSTIVDLNTEVGGKKVSSFAEPIDVAIPYTLSDGDNPDSITVFLLKDDGTIEPVGGKYDPVTGKVRFTIDHFSKYFAKPAVKEFSDLDGYVWAEKEIELLAGKGIIKGKTDDKFDPGAEITRAEFAALIARMLKLRGNVEEIPFTDVAPDAWYAREIAAVYVNGIVNGKSPTEFAPCAKITREEMATMIARVLRMQGYAPAKEERLTVFGDADTIASWAKSAVATAVREGIINGMENGIFAPKDNANRAQAAVVIYRLFSK